jgi:hypothetical protein
VDFIEGSPPPPEEATIAEGADPDPEKKYRPKKYKHCSKSEEKWSVFFKKLLLYPMALGNS